ncbi:phosphoadenosine phosphosulfate reductase family protein [Dyadobacter psychrotolerans]|uniref:Phosphoadenosine phosphosulfate reductase n=1 Tax=Dyadobacter psychrotolerans TaxID=2541721 RepID=A0A4R5DSN4_9BACT|nr:phosphoadenosine phosphosulfate reductase family protein [Dyadobacter psychrotolerans]TDE15280.1 phosphoadenosine phosphosulfate reductase [Dyadobacter psychrotolerans]
MVLVINFSGGKDSCAMLAYLCEKYPDTEKHVVFADTGWEHKDAESWSRGIVESFGLHLNVARNPNKTFLEMVVRRKMFPGMQTRQCTSDLKRGPIQTWIRQNVTDKLVINCMGIRSEESPNRKKAKHLSRNKSMTNSRRTVWDWNPIKDWNSDQVFNYLKMHNIPLHPVYKYLSRFSCRVCIYMSAHDVHQVKINDPEAFKIIEHLENQIGFTMFQSGSITTI